MPPFWKKPTDKPATSEPPTAIPAPPPAPAQPSSAEKPAPVVQALPVTLRIEAPPKALIEQEGTTVKLPVLRVVPLDTDYPPKVTLVRVTGQCPNNQAWADFLTQAYDASRKQVPPKLVKATSIDPRPGVWPADQPISKDVPSSLLIHVEYYPTSADGKPLGATPLIEERIVELVPGDGLRPTATLRVMPAHLLKVYEAEDRGIGPRLTIRVMNDAPEKPVQGEAKKATRVDVTLTAVDVKMTAASWGCPGLEQAVEDMLQGVKAALRQTPEDGAILHHVPRFRLRSSDREMLFSQLRKPNAKPLRLPVRIQATGAVPVTMLFELHPQGIIREGLVVFDLGTSASTAARYDPMIVDESAFPREQLAQLREDYAKLLDKPGPNLLAEAESYWLRLLSEVCRACDINGGDHPARALLEVVQFRGDCMSGAEKFYEVVRQLELHLWGLSGGGSEEERKKLQRFQEKLSERMHHIYMRAFDKVSLGRWNIQLCRPESTVDDFVVSELELEDVYPQPTGVLGLLSAARRLQWLEGKDIPLIGQLEDGRFLNCPKEFLSRIHDETDLTQSVLPPVTRRNQEQPVPLTAREVMQAAWESLIRLVNGDPKPGKPAIDHVVATYPADLMPEPRQALEQSLRQLGMVGVYLDYDESISPAVFHLEQLFGNMEEIGCEAFKVQCVKSGNVWAHHMLVLDIGAGTTDISLIRLEMRERHPDNTTYGGCVYQITPRLLGAAGRSRSGGHLLTLHLFRVLKQLLAGWVRQVGAALNQPTEPNAETPHHGDYILSGTKDDIRLAKALDLAEEVIPTRYHELLSHIHKRGTEAPNAADLRDARQRLKRFSVLWSWAEEMKVCLSETLERLSGAGLPAVIRIHEVGGLSLKERMEALLTGTDNERLLPELTKTDPPFVKVRDFIQLAQDSVKRSVELATGMAVSALKSFGERLEPKEELSLQSVVLSGRACALPQVRDLLAQKLKQQALGEGKARILFRRGYAKSATAIGACRAQRRVANARDYTGPITGLDGKCEMDLRIQNLYFYLPSEYRLGTGNDDLGTRVFARHTEFSQVGRTPHGIIRSSGDVHHDEAANAAWDKLFTQPQRETSIYRDDGDGQGVLWGKISLQNLTHKPIDNRDLLQESATWRMRFEITHQRRLYALLIRPNAAGQVVPIFDIGTPVEDPHMIAQLPEANTTALFGDQAKASCPVDFYDKAPGEGVLPLVAGVDMRKISCLRATAPKPNESHDVPAWIGPIMKLDIRADGMVNFYVVDPKTRKSLGTVHFSPRPLNPDNPGQVESRFPFFTRYRLVIASDGRVALVIGPEPRYWETTQVEEWLRGVPGLVFRFTMDMLPQPEDWWNEPFSGRH